MMWAADDDSECRRGLFSRNLLHRVRANNAERMRGRSFDGKERRFGLADCGAVCVSGPATDVAGCEYCTTCYPRGPVLPGASAAAASNDSATWLLSEHEPLPPLPKRVPQSVPSPLTHIDAILSTPNNQWFTPASSPPGDDQRGERTTAGRGLGPVVTLKTSPTERSFAGARSVKWGGFLGAPRCASRRRER